MNSLLIPTISGSVRAGRKSHLVAAYLNDQLGRMDGVDTDLLDLVDYPFPILVNRPSASSPLPPELESFRQSLQNAHGILIVAPEYKNGIPGALKNVIDHLEPGAFQRKAIGICTVSAGGFGGLGCMAQLQNSVLALGGIPVPGGLPISHVGKLFEENSPPDDASLRERSRTFLRELAWYSEALERQNKFECLTSESG